MNKHLLLVCLLLTGIAPYAPAQSNQLLRCQVKTVSIKVKDTKGNWTGWRELPAINEKTPGNIVFDFVKMSLYSDLKPLDNGSGLDRGVHISRIVEIAHDTTFKEYGFYCIKFKCRDENANLTSYDLLSLGFNECHTLLLIATADNIITRQELEMQ